MREKRACFSVPIAVTVLLLAVTACLTQWTDLDMALMRPFAPDAPGAGWRLRNAFLTKTFFHAAGITVGILGVAALVGLVAGFRDTRLKPFRIHFAYILLVIAVGSGILVNGLIKVIWGRPRPREIVEFGGDIPYRGILQPQPWDGCLSFPSGHASAAVLPIAVWLVLRRRAPGAARCAFLATGILGVGTSLSRTAAGAHFASDNLFGAGISLLTALVLYGPVLDIPGRERSNDPTRVAPSWPRVAWIGGLVLFLCAATLPVQPLRSRLRFGVDSAPVRHLPHDVEIRLARGTLDVEAQPGADLSARGVSRGLAGFLSSTGMNFAYNTNDCVVTARLTAVPSGWLTRVSASAAVSIPADNLRSLRVEVSDATVRMRGPPPSKLTVVATRSVVSLPVSWNSRCAQLSLSDSRLLYARP
jgi:membrane-associated PAP2 superfamily phosphatase